MPDNALNSINFDKYFSLLHKLMPAAPGFSICDTDGKLIETSGNTGELVKGAHIDLNAFKPASTGNPEYNTCFSVTPAGKALIKIDIYDRTRAVIASLLAVSGHNTPDRDSDTDTVNEESLQTIASCISSDNDLVVELNAMAKELAGRYEELNLVYDTNDDIIEFEHETEAYNQLLNNCLDYLDLGAAILIWPEQASVNCVAGRRNPVREPLNLIPLLSSELFAAITETREAIIINEFSDPARSKLNLLIPYKLMASPVITTQNSVSGMLVCLNHMSKPDFFNSDKNLLQVMSRKVSKIKQTNYDDLTGLMNMHAFQPCLLDAIYSSREKGSLHSLLNIDLERLRVINDTFGRDAGDATISTVSGILKKELRHTDSICYLGEGRFGVLLENSNLEQGLQVARNIRETINNHDIEWNSEAIEINLSIGMALIEPGTPNTEAALEAAEIARESAKESGINQIQVYRHDDQDLAERKNQMQWVSRIQVALRNDMFRLYCQEIQPLTRTNENYHFEILLRLEDESGGIVPPGEFIAPAERFNLMPLLDRWVIDNTFAVLAANRFAQQAGEGIVSINLSGQSLTDETLIDYICEKLTEYRLISNCICFEITETAAIGNMKSAHKVIVSLKEKGFHFSLDDFGTGLSSFSYLKDLPVDFLKIDGSFVRSILDDRISYAMVSSINQIGHVIGLKTIAEYVETDDIKQQLQLIGVDYAQGYSITRPTPVEQYLALLDTESAQKAC